MTNYLMKQKFWKYNFKNKKQITKIFIEQGRKISLLKSIKNGGINNEIISTKKKIFRKFK